MMQTLSEATAIRLYNSVVVNGQSNGTNGGVGGGGGGVGGGGTVNTALTTPVPPIGAMHDPKSLESIHSANEFGNSCRICRWNRSDMQVLRCPCHCKGSVGFVHMQCLRRWIMHRRDGRCEICNTPFTMPDERINITRMFKAFMCARCFGAIAKHLIFSASLLPLAHVVLQQVMLCMENLNQNENEALSVHEVVLASFALLTSSALFFQYFEFISTRFMLIRNIFRQWWFFGNTSEFSLLDIDSDTFEYF